MDAVVNLVLFCVGQTEGRSIPIMYLQSFPTPSKLLKLPAVEPSSALLSVHSTSPLKLEIVEQGKEQRDQSMKLIGERSDEEEVVSSGS